MNAECGWRYNSGAINNLREISQLTGKSVRQAIISVKSGRRAVLGRCERLVNTASNRVLLLHVYVTDVL